jgi:ferredoxin
MNTTIYYYSATGNSLVIARKIAERIGDTRVLPLARYRQTPATPATTRVGIVFPIIAWGPPRTVNEFLYRLNLDGVRYVFAVASCGGTAAGALPRIRRILREKGGDLNADFIVRSSAYIEMKGPQAAMADRVRKLSGRPFPGDEERLPEIIDAVRSERGIKAERAALLGTIVGNFFHDKAESSFAGLSGYYKVAPTCAGCGTCLRVCPRGNVSRHEGKTAWGMDCEFCGACATWCPQHAIGFSGNVEPTRKRNPGVIPADFLLR